MENKIVMAMVALMVAALAAPAVMAADVNYSATVTDAANVAVATNTVAFGNLLAGTTNEIINSLTLTNTGNSNANVNAKFTTNNGTIYGLTTTGNDVIAGNNFGIGTSGEVSLNHDSANGVDLGTSNQVPADGAVNYNVTLAVPAGQIAGEYTGTVQLTFTTVV